MELRGRIALVTGAGHRVGRAIALALGARGMRVAVHYNSAAKGADETVRMIVDAGGEAISIPGDLTKPAAAPALLAPMSAPPERRPVPPEPRSGKSQASSSFSPQPVSVVKSGRALRPPSP